MNKIKLAVGQEYLDQYGSKMEVSSVGKLSFLVLRGCGMETQIPKSTLPSWTLTKHQSGHVIESDCDYVEHEDDAYMWVADNLFLRPKSLLKQHGLEIGDLWYRGPEHKVLVEVVSETNTFDRYGDCFSDQASDLESFIYLLTCKPQDWSKVEGDSPEAGQFFPLRHSLYRRSIICSKCGK